MLKRFTALVTLAVPAIAGAYDPVQGQPIQNSLPTHSALRDNGTASEASSTLRKTKTRRTVLRDASRALVPSIVLLPGMGALAASSESGAPNGPDCSSPEELSDDERALCRRPERPTAPTHERVPKKCVYLYYLAEPTSLGGNERRVPVAWACWSGPGVVGD